MSESSDLSGLSKIYEESGKVRISLEGKKFNKIRKYAEEHFEQFWAEQAKNLVWFKEWDKILDWRDPPFAKWFVGGKLNACVNCLDRHLTHDNNNIKNKAAIIWEGENGENRTFTYYQLYRSVNIFANALKNIGVMKDDRVTIYLPMVPELPIAMLSCARIGAIHNVVFSGFSSQALVNRINDSKSKIVITADGSYRRGKLLELKRTVDEAIADTPSVEHVVVLKRASNIVRTGSKDVWWHDIIENTSQYCEPEVVDSSHPLYILYTSGTTGKPKGVVHDTGGYLCHLNATAKWVYNFRKDDIYFCTADIGWVTGHSYIVYAPLMHGVTEIMYDGKQYVYCTWFRISGLARTSSVRARPPRDRAAAWPPSSTPRRAVRAPLRASLTALSVTREPLDPAEEHARRELRRALHVGWFALDHRHPHLQCRADHRRGHVVGVDLRHDAELHRGAQVGGELVDAGAEDRLVEHRPDRAAVAAHERERLGVVGEKAEVLAVAGGDELLERTRLAARGLHPRADLLRALLEDRAKQRLLVGEVVVERAAGEVGAADDVAHRRAAVAELGEDAARRVEDRGAVGGLRRRAAAAGPGGLRFLDDAHAGAPSPTTRAPARAGTGSVRPAAAARAAPRRRSRRRS